MLVFQLKNQFFILSFVDKILNENLISTMFDQNEFLDLFYNTVIIGGIVSFAAALIIYLVHNFRF